MTTKRKPIAGIIGITLGTIRHPSGALFVTLTDATTGQCARLSFPTPEDAQRAGAFLALLTRAIPAETTVAVDVPGAPVVAVTPHTPRRRVAQRKVGVAA
ncbi:MAG TPA: hypothetical protein VMV29_08825 [Ktedonobacterales bacterium]|nr:hypothetical protein [Ktedonobacterales bacterium]